MKTNRNVALKFAVLLLVLTFITGCSKQGENTQVLDQNETHTIEAEANEKDIEEPKLSHETARTLSEHFTAHDQRVWYLLDDNPRDGKDADVDDIIVVENGIAQIYEAPYELSTLGEIAKISDDEVIQLTKARLDELVTERKGQITERLNDFKSKYLMEEIFTNPLDQGYVMEANYSKEFAIAYLLSQYSEFDSVSELIGKIDAMSENEYFETQVFESIVLETDVTELMKILDDEYITNLDVVIEHNEPAVQFGVLTDSTGNTVSQGLIKFVRLGFADFQMDPLQYQLTNLSGEMNDFFDVENVVYDELSKTLVIKKKLITSVGNKDMIEVLAMSSPRYTTMKVLANQVSKYYPGPTAPDDYVPITVYDSNFDGFYLSGVNEEVKLDKAVITRSDKGELFELDEIGADGVEIDPKDF